MSNAVFSKTLCTFCRYLTFMQDKLSSSHDEFFSIVTVKIQKDCTMVMETGSDVTTVFATSVSPQNYRGNNCHYCNPTKYIVVIVIDHCLK
jgi:hypothetical protein